MRIRKTLYAWLTTRFSVIVRNEENLEDKYFIPITPAIVVFVGFVAFTIVFTLGLLLGSFILKRTTAQGLQEAKIKQQIYTLNVTIDSLAQALQAREVYIQDFKKVMGGNLKKLRNNTELFINDSLSQNTTTKTGENVPQFKFNADSLNIDYLAPADLKLRKEFENPVEALSLRSADFITPIEGVIQKQFNLKKQQYGVLMTAPAETSVRAINAGRILNITQENGQHQTVVIQHAGGLVSIYKKCVILSKKVGNFVETGEVIGTLGNHQTANQFIFEVWYQGTPLDPEKFINF